MSAGAWSWQRSPGSAEDRGYRRKASLLGQVEGKASEVKKKKKKRWWGGESWHRGRLGQPDKGVAWETGTQKDLGAGRPVLGQKQTMCSGQGAYTCVDSVVCLHLMLE